ncbi:MAG TPA: Asp-tRNA(Asn)/Glu-tRNA(Gln) amidotransferase subunit GatB [Acidimicrobiales bacterium]|jgi:aspartyl-tRNA(Asn)/glutamyl-tRNA(Gln) amidotransferase subunit B|nr:Asp-tRNA(Asn)/Glu-tRNA(Gln) amidotransferase subunit GatB [Acidimicrobiales bacterium]
MTATETEVVHEFAPGWELVVGLEVHCELSTRTKLFCGCPNQFGSEPNTNICPTCLGLPGSLPVLNAAAVEFAMRLGRALHCTVNPAVFARKNYFYPDMPKDYQVSQYDLPTNTNGYLDLPDGTRVGIVRAHIEEDTGKSSHQGGDGRIHGASYSLVDYNRAGVPLVEIVSEPDIRTVEQARSYVDELRKIVTAIGVSDAKMEEGSMRVDANVSVRPVGSSELRTRCEIKNINSIRSLGRAIEFEAHRHIDLYDAGERPRQETRHWDEEHGRTRPGRSKEDAEDYRYFPEPDLLPLEPSAADVARVDASLPALPAERRARLAATAGVAPADVSLIVDRHHDGFALSVLALGIDERKALVRIENDLAPDTPITIDPAHFARLIAMETNGELTATQAKQVLAEMVDGGGTPDAIARTKGFEAMAADALESVVDAIIAANPDDWAQFVAADEKSRKRLSGFFTGQVMKATQGKADGRAVNELLTRRAAVPPA